MASTLFRGKLAAIPYTCRCGERPSHDSTGPRISTPQKPKKPAPFLYVITAQGHRFEITIGAI